MSRLGFAKLYVSDLDAMAHFCVEALGATEMARIALDDMDEVMMSMGGEAPDLVLMRLREPRPPETGTLYGPVGVIVDACDDAVAAFIAAGGKQLMAPVDVPDAGARVAFVATPEGHSFELVQNVEN